MVVNPENLVQKIEHHEAQRIAAVEAYIDKTLETAFDGTKAIVPGDHGFRGMRDFVLKGLLDRYRAAGWNIKYQLPNIKYPVMNWKLEIGNWIFQIQNIF